MHRLAAIGTAVLILGGIGLAWFAQLPGGRAPAARVSFVAVEEGVQLEVIDWGGSGRPIVLLAGSGNTAHVFDDFAPELASRWHTYGITRRGFGASSRPGSGYDDQRLANDVLTVIDSLNIDAPVLIGHLMAGGELTTLGNQHSTRLGGLVYLDAIADPGDAAGKDARVMAAYNQQPLAARSSTPSDRSSFSAYRASQMRNTGGAFPESELRHLFTENADGSVGSFKGSTARINAAIGAGQKKRAYSGIAIPVLVISTFLCSSATGGRDHCVEHSSDRAKYQPRDTIERASIEQFEALENAYISRWKANVRKTATGKVRIVDMPRAMHHIFLSHEADVLGELSAFMASL